MPRLLACSQGHQWEADDAAPAQPPRCPVCGQAGTDPDTRANKISTDGAATILESPTWQPLSPADVQGGPPPRLEAFEVLAEIGHGGMGIVYKALQRGDGQTVALKVIRKDRLLHEESVRRFRREAQAAARLSHPNIVRVFDSDHTGDTHYLVMEYVDGVTLERLVEQSGPLSVARACDVIRQAALALQHALEQALVHRDIKPSNLMVAPAPDPRGDDGSAPLRVKVLDMGVARVLQRSGAPGESLSTLTQGGAVIGTADFVAPEQIENPHLADIRADLYSLGCTFYYLLAGRVPFPGGSLVSKLDKQRWQDPTPLRELRPDIPAAVALVVHRLMAKRPDGRYRTPGELAEILANLARNDYRGPTRPAVRVAESRRLTGHTDAVWAVRYSPDGQQLATAGKDRAIVLWDSATGKLARRLPPQMQEVRALAWAPTGDRLASAGGITQRLWDAATGAEQRRLSGHSATVRCLAFSVDEAWLLSGGDDRTLRAWDLVTGREALRLTRHTGAVTCVALLTATNQLLTGSRDQSLRLWDLPNGQEVRSLDAGGGAVLDVAVAPDGLTAASAHFDTTIRLWDLMTWRLIATLEGHRQMASAVAFTPDGKRLVSASHDQTLRLWDTESGEELACVPCHAGGILSLSVHPAGTHVATGSADRTVCILDLPS